MEFYFDGGTARIGAYGSAKFLAFLVSAGQEIPFYDALRKGIVRAVQSRPGEKIDVLKYETECNVIKIFIKESDFGNQTTMASFYLTFGAGFGQTVTIKPRSPEAKAWGWHFSMRGRFLKKSEATALFPANSLQRRMIETIPLPAVPILREIVTIEKPEEIKKVSAVREMRIRKPRNGGKK